MFNFAEEAEHSFANLAHGISLRRPHMDFGMPDIVMREMVVKLRMPDGFVNII